MNKDLKKLFKQLNKMGFTITMGGKHYKITSAKGNSISCSGTPSCMFAIKHIKGDINRLLKKEGSDERI